MVWIETLHPVSHELDVTWAVDGTVVANTHNSRNLDLAALNLAAGTHSLTATVVDPTDFVRDPAIRSSTALTQKLTWTVNTALTTTPVSTPVAFTSSTATTRPVGAKDVMYAETTHPTAQVLNVAWVVDGTVVANPHNSRSLNLASLNLGTGTHAVTATVTDPATPGTSQVLGWQIDATLPSAGYTLSTPAKTITQPGGTTEYVFNGPFDMKLTASDDVPGYVVAEYRIDGDGWQNYYGWPTSEHLPMHFSETGTNIDDLNYGKLAKGRHTIEYRAIDAAGNIGAAKSFVVTLIDGANSQVITADVLGGALSVSFGGSSVTMPATTLTGYDQIAHGVLNPATVIDARGTSAGWSLTGQVSDFVGTNGVIVADNLGWSPTASTVTGSLPTSPGSGSVVQSGPNTTPGAGSGLANSRMLCQAQAGSSGGAFTCAAGLDLGIPGSTLAGTFTGVLTLTLI